MHLLRVFLLLLAAAGGGTLHAAETAAGRPNILFILTDDQGWPTLGSYGNRLVPTPHLDRLAAEGMRFTAAYVMPQCTPTRAALLTGQHTARNGMWHVIPWYGYPWSRMEEIPFVESLPPSTFTLAKGLRAAGYATACLGKWHLSGNEDGGYVALKPVAADKFGFDFSPAPPDPKYHQTGDKGVDWLTDQALAFAGQQRDRPWFVYLAHHTIHGPVVAPQDLVAKYRARGAPETGLHNAVYLAAIEHFDHSIGRLMAGLERLGQRERTMMVFLTDNGGVDTVYQNQPVRADDGSLVLPIARREFSNAPLRAGKGSHYEGGIRVPCLVRWPGVVRAGSVNTTPVHVVDWLPTLLEVAGGRIPAGHVADGVSLVPVLRGGALPPRPLFWYLPFYELLWGATPAAIIRDGDFKLIEFFGDWFDPDGRYVPGHRIELFNLRDDLGETRNLAAAEPRRAAEMRERLRAWMKSIPVPVPGPNSRYDPKRELTVSRTKPTD